MDEHSASCLSAGSKAVLSDLWQILADPLRPAEIKLDRALNLLAEHIEMELGFITMIDEESNDYQLVFPNSLPTDLESDTVYPLDTTFCRKTIQHSENVFAIASASEEGWNDDPAYHEFGLESYLGTVIEDTAGLYGTLCFGAYSPRGRDFRREEFTLVELVKDWTNSHLQSGVPFLSFDRSIEEYEWTESRDIDAVLAILQHADRRAVIRSLVSPNGSTTVDRILNEVDGSDQFAMGLLHQHLPKMEANDIIEWDRTEGIVRPGPGFRTTHHILRILDATNGYESAAVTASLE